jgi:hypothetical protein
VVLQHLFHDTHLTIRFFRLLLHPPGNLDRRYFITGRRNFFEPGTKFLLMRSVPLCPRRQVFFCCQTVRLCVVAFVVRQDEVVSEASQLVRVFDVKRKRMVLLPLAGVRTVPGTP